MAIDPFFHLKVKQNYPNIDIQEKQKKYNTLPDIFPVRKGYFHFASQDADKQRFELAKNDEILSAHLDIIAEQNKLIIAQNDRILKSLAYLAASKYMYPHEDSRELAMSSFTTAQGS